jgi:hypothetical protein
VRPSCGSETKISFDTVTLATTPFIQCKGEECEYVAYGRSAARVSLPQFDDNRNHNTDYALNVLYVLGFISNGNGPIEAGRLLGILGLPNDTTMATQGVLV